MMDLLKKAAAIIGVVLVLLFILGFGVSLDQYAPSNVKVMADHKYKTFIAPTCLDPKINYETANYTVVTLNVAQSEFKYSAESVCTSESLHVSKSLIRTILLEKIGLLGPKAKWNDDGTWNL